MEVTIIVKGIKNFFKEFSELKTFKSLPHESRQVVFYAESPIYYHYYADIIDNILKSSSLEICYITSGPEDPVFQRKSTRFHVFYLYNMVAPFIRELDARVLVMTMPDIEQYHIKRSIYKVNHLYVYHAIVSTHMVYRKGAFDHYDTIFCVGPHHKEEIRKTEKIYGLPRKTLIEAGYPRLERIYQDHMEHKKKSGPGEKDNPLILIAPSWAKNNIIEEYSEELLSHLLSLGDNYTIVFRPHPQFLRASAGFIHQLEMKFKDKKNVVIETNLVSDVTIHSAAILITDWSGIAFEYAFGTERPVLFIDTPRKVNNPDYEALDIEPLIVKLRNKIGRSVSPYALHTIPGVISQLLKEQNTYREKIIAYRNTYIYNWGKSARTCADYIIQLCSSPE